jgi:uncharacterized protein (TIGR00730 family)
MGKQMRDENDPVSGQMNVPAKELPKIKPPKRDWRSSFHWRVFRIMAEFVDGFQFLEDFKKTVTFFGSARFDEKNRWYREAQKLARLLSKSEFSIVSGGGPGIMEAANKGAVEGEKGDSIGLNIQLPYEQRVNPYVRKPIGFHYFFTRKVMLSYSAQAYVFFPGGFGTLDEVFEILTLIQTHKIYDRIPVVLVGKDFWGTLDNFLREKLMNEHKTIDPEDLNLYHIVDTAEEAFSIIKKSKPREEF